MAAGKLLAAARKMAAKIVSGGFSETITLQTPNGLNVLELNGLSSKHWLNFDNNGNSINSKNAHISINEADLIAADYPYRNTNEEISLKKHRVTVADATGQNKEFVINETMPSETFGTIICILGDFKELIK